jgi:hypothetical protein
MKNFTYSFVLLFLLSSCGNKKNNPSNPQDIGELQKIAADTANFTQIQWIDSVYNFGTIEEGAQIQVQFKFKNIGIKPLYLTEVKAGCGCTTPDYTKEAIEPSKEGWINGVFDSKNQMGEVHKYIMVKTNTVNGTEHKLMFTGTVNKK